jgi:transposase
MMPLVLPQAESAERSRLLSVNHLRQRALQRLYARRDAVDDLIRSLENYSKAQEADEAGCLEFSPGRKCS